MVHSAFYRGLEAAAGLPHAGAAATGATAAALRARAVAAHGLADGLIAPIATAGWACRRGCAHCCRHPVGITLPEAVALADAVRAHPLATRLAAAVVAAARATAGAPWTALALESCPLLDGGACAAYERRPVACRAWGSADAEACARHAADQHETLPFDRTAFGTGLGIGHALAADLGHRELRAALAAVLAVDGDDVPALTGAFAAARPAGDAATATVVPAAP